MRTHQNTEGFLGELDALALPPGSWVVTDADGTLWDTDIADAAWRRLLSQRRILGAAAQAMRRLVEEGGVGTTGDVHEDARTLGRLFRAGRVGDDPVIVGMTCCYAGWSQQDLRGFGTDLAREVIASRVLETTLPMLEALARRRHHLVVVSGSPRVLVEEALRVLGREPLPLVLGTDLTQEGGLFTDQVVRPLTWGKGKLEALEAAVGDVPISVAFGDSPGDLALLEAAQDLRVLVHPRPGLRKAAGGWNTRWCILAPPRTVGGELVRARESDWIV